MFTHTLDFVRNVVPIGYGTCITSPLLHIVNINNLCIPATNHKPPPVHRAHTVAILHSSDNRIVSSYSTSNLILDTEFPAMEPPLQKYNNVVFGRRFSVLISKEHTSCVRQLSNAELLSCYSIQSTQMDDFFNKNKYTRLFDNNMHFCIPINMRASVTNSLIDHVGFTDNTTFSDSD